MHVEDPCLVEEEFPNPVIALLSLLLLGITTGTTAKHLPALRFNNPFTCIWYYYIIAHSWDNYLDERNYSKDLEKKFCKPNGTVSGQDFLRGVGRVN